MAGSTSKPSRLTSDQRGASAVEFALLMPVFLLLVLGMMAYAIYFGAAHSIQQLAADAARVAVAGINHNERAALATAHIEAQAKAYMLIDPARLDVISEPDEADPHQFRVTLRYDASALPIWNLYPPLPLPSRTIAFRSTIRNGGS